MSVKEKLTKSELKISAFIINNSKKTKNMNSYDISEAVNVSQATVIRFSKKLGFDSFIDLVKSIDSSGDKDIVENEINPKETIEETNKKVVSLYTDVISLVEQENSAKLIKELVADINNKNKIIIFGIGNSALSAIDFATKLNKFGVSAFASQDPHIMLSMVSNLDEDDLLILISSSGETRDIITAAKLAMNNSIKIISITSLTKSKLYDFSDIILKTSSTRSQTRLDATSSRISQLVLIDMIFINFLKHDYSKHKKYIENSDSVIENINKKSWVCSKNIVSEIIVR